MTTPGGEREPADLGDSPATRAQKLIDADNGLRSRLWRWIKNMFAGSGGSPSAENQADVPGPRGHADDDDRFRRALEIADLPPELKRDLQTAIVLQRLLLHPPNRKLLESGQLRKVAEFFAELDGKLAARPVGAEPPPEIRTHQTHRSSSVGGFSDTASLRSASSERTGLWADARRTPTPPSAAPASPEIGRRALGR